MPPTSAARLAALRRRPDFPLLRRTDNVRPPFPMQHLAGALFGCVFTIVPIFMLSTMRSFDSELPDFPAMPTRMPHIDSLFTLVPAIFICIGLGIAGWNLYKLVTKLRTGLTALPACVLSRRTDVTRTKNSSRTRYFVGLELERSRRQELECTGGLYSTLRDDEIGVAITRGAELVAFRPA